MASWSDYQEEVATFFRQLGLAAETNVAVPGVRTSHDIDVVVRSEHAGFHVLWVVECKAWKRAITKEKVLALRSIVDDIGADRGFVMAERGYQSGALEAARYANVMLTSLGDLRETLAFEVGMAKLKSLLERAESCRDRYWSISKSHRIEYDLRPDVGTGGFSGNVLIGAVEYAVRQAIFKGFPLTYDRTAAALSSFGGGRDVAVDPDDVGALQTPTALYDILDAELAELERRLDAAERGLQPSPPQAPHP